MALIEGADSRDGQAFGCGDDRRVDGSERKVSVEGYELGDAEPVRRSYRLRQEVPGREIAEEPYLRLDAQPGAE